MDRMITKKMEALASVMERVAASVSAYTDGRTLAESDIPEVAIEMIALLLVVSRMAGGSLVDVITRASDLGAQTDGAIAALFDEVAEASGGDEDAAVNLLRNVLMASRRSTN